jgi:hypothetical protein
MIDLITDGQGDWHGVRRRPQGTCVIRPATLPPDTTPRFTVPAGTRCMVRKATEADWRPYTTTRESGFDRYQRIVGGFYEFREGLWLLGVNIKDVKVRKS